MQTIKSTGQIKLVSRLVFTLVAAAFFTGCVTRITDFTVLSTKNIDLSQASNFKRASARVTGEDQAFVILIIPTGVPTVKEAVDQALQSVPGGIALVDGVVKTRNWWLIFGENTMIVEGTPLIDPSLVGNK